MLKLSLKPGEYIDIGKDIRIVFSGGSSNNIHLLVDAPREYNIARSSAKEVKDRAHYYKEKPISEEAQKQIAGIIRREKLASEEKEVRPCKKAEKRNIYTVHNTR